MSVWPLKTVSKDKLKWPDTGYHSVPEDLMLSIL